MKEKTALSVSHMVSQKEENIVSDMDGEKVMLSISNGKYYNLGEIGGEIWERMINPISIEELVNQLMAHYDVEQSDCEAQVISFIEHLYDEGLVEKKERLAF